MTPISTTYIAEYVKIIAMLAVFFGYELNVEEITTLIASIVVICSTLWTLKERFKRGDITKLGRRL